MSRVSVSDAVDMVSSSTFYNVRNPSALVQSKLKDKSHNVDPFHANECWANFDEFATNSRHLSADATKKSGKRARSLVRPRPGIDGKTSSASTIRRTDAFMGRADANRAPLDPYSRFSGSGGVKKAVGLNLKLPPGLIAKVPFHFYSNQISNLESAKRKNLGQNHQIRLYFKHFLEISKSNLINQRISSISATSKFRGARIKSV